MIRRHQPVEAAMLAKRHFGSWFREMTAVGP